MPNSPGTRVQQTLIWATLALFSCGPIAHADNYGFLGSLALVPTYGGHPTPGQEILPEADSYTESLSGDWGTAANWQDSPYPYVYSPGGNGTSAIMYNSTLPGANDTVSIGGVPVGMFVPSEGPADNSDPNDPVYGYHSTGAGGFAGYTGSAFNVTGAAGTIADLNVSGPGTLTLGGLTVTGTATFASQGGIPIFAWDASATYQDPVIFTGDFGPSVQTVTGGSLNTSFLILYAGTNTYPENGTGPTPDPVADAGSLIINGASLTGTITQVVGTPYNYGPSGTATVDPVLLQGATLAATQELDLVGVDPTVSPGVTGTTTLTSTSSTITAASVVIGTGTSGYGTGSADAYGTELDLESGSHLSATGTGAAQPSLVVGDTGDGTLYVDESSSISSVEAVVGNEVLTSGTVTLDGGTWQNSSFLAIGSSGQGVVNVQASGSLTTSDTLYVGLESDSVGTLAISDGGSVTADTTGIDGPNSVVVGTDEDSTGSITIDGQDSILESKGDMQIGYEGDGSVSITNGGELKVDGELFRLGHEETGNGFLEAIGSGSTISAEDSAMSVGYSGTGILNVFEGASITTGSMTIGEMETGVGNANFDGSSTTGTLGVTVVGDAGQGLLTVTGGANVNTGSITLGNQEDSEGDVLVSGDGSTLAADGDMVVGNEGNGSMQVSENANVTVSALKVADGDGGTGMLIIETGGNVTASDDSTIAGGEDSTGEIDVDGTSSKLKIQGDLTIGGSGDGTLAITDNATVLIQAGTVGDEDGSNGTVTIDGTGSILHASQDFTIGKTGAGDVTVSNGGTLQVDGDLTIGKEAGSDGSLTIDGANSTFTYSGGDISVGASGSGALTVQNGAFVSLEGTSVNVGDADDDTNGDPGSGTLTVTGADSTLITGDLSVGSKGDGDLFVENGGTLSTGDGTVGDEEDSDGIATITGAGSSWTATGMTVGGMGDGELDIEDGGSVTVNGSDFTIGDEKSGNGIVTLSGADSKLNFSGELNVGENGTGVFAVQGGASFTTDKVNVGDLTGSTGTLNIDGANTFMEVQRDFNVGENGAGALNVTNGATLLTDGAPTLGDMTGSTSTAKVDAGASWNVGGELTVANQGIATMTVSNGGFVSALNVTLGEIKGAGGQVTVTGTGTPIASTLKFTNELKVGDGGAGELDVDNGGQVAATGSGTDEASVAVQAGSTGTVNVDGSGSHFDATSLILGGDSHVTGGQAAFNLTNGGTAHIASSVTTGSQGVLNVTGGGMTVGSTATLAPVGELLINSGGSLGGNGKVIGNVVNGGTVAPGDPATLTIQGNYTQTSAGELVLDISGAGPGGYDTLDVTGELSLGPGAKLVLDFTGGYAPTAGDSFKLIDTGSIDPANNTFASITVEGLQSGFEFSMPTTGPDAFDLTALDDGVPEAPSPRPASYTLFGLSLLALLSYRRLKRGR